MVELVRGSKVAPSILSQDLSVSGQIVSSGDVQIEGVLEGDLRSHAVTIGEKARVTGEISGELVTVRGFVKGTIRARQVHLCASCHVVGDIYHEALAIETGAHLDGVVRREKDPLANASISLIEEETKSGQLLAG
ncbi:MAG: bactofilin family protein [Parvibaculales bacterium]